MKSWIPENLNGVSILIEFESQKKREEWKPHPGFGYFTKQQWGQMQYKHLGHHFRPFGV